MDELISRQAAIDALEQGFKDMTNGIDKLSPTYGLTKAMTGIYKCYIGKLPPAEPKRIKGKWVGADTQCGIACSVCGVAVDDFCHSADYMDLDYEPNFCPNCGAKMEVNHESN